MKTVYDLSTLSWQLAGGAPYQVEWETADWQGINKALKAEIRPLPAPVPGSVQRALRNAGLLPDWNVAFNSRACEWVEHRWWVYQVTLPDGWQAAGKTIRLHCEGLDYCGRVRVNGKDAGEFTGTFVPHTFDLTSLLTGKGDALQIVFEGAPKWLGQYGYTSQMTEWKTRFNYTWDWTSRLVQFGIWDAITLEVSDGQEFTRVSARTNADFAAQTGVLHLAGEISGEEGTQVRVILSRDGAAVLDERISRVEFLDGTTFDGFPVALWWPNGHGEQPLYDLHVELLDANGVILDADERQVGFKHVTWEPCAGAPPEADPWICVVNGKPIFLQGVNWTPIDPFFADVPDVEVEKRVRLYRELGCNILRIWGGAVLEKENFYRYCDGMGLLVWQEFPMSSSGVENWPPEDAQAIDEMAAIAESYVTRRQHHVSLLCWCGGNELQGGIAGEKWGCGVPVTLAHPMIARLNGLVQALDPERRFLPTSASGPRFTAEAQNFGKGQHWDVHGPWAPDSDVEGAWREYWANDDALFRSELGCPGASPADIIRASKGEEAELPATLDNPLWRRTSWWIDWRHFTSEFGRDPESLEEYVAWSQARQRRALEIAVGACKARFPGIGGAIIWMGHDCFPCTANTAIVDLHANPKPAGLGVAEIFKAPQPEVSLT